MAKSTNKARAPSISRPLRISRLIGKCSIDQIGEMAQQLVSSNRNVAKFVAGAIELELQPKQHDDNEHPFGFEGPATMNLGGISIPVEMSTNKRSN